MFPVDRSRSTCRPIVGVAAAFGMCVVVTGCGALVIWTIRLSFGIVRHAHKGGLSVKKRSVALKIAALANAILLVTAFVGCPACKNRTDIMPATISPVRDDFQRFMPATISPPPEDFQRLLPPTEKVPPPQQETKTDRPGSGS